MFTGLVEGGGRGEIEFAATGTAAMGSNISGFNTVALANGGADSLTLATANFAGVDGRFNRARRQWRQHGQCVGGDEQVSSPIDGGAGADVLTGSGNGGAIFVFTAAALTATDKIAGGGGFNNELEVTTAGTVAAGWGHRGRDLPARQWRSQQPDLGQRELHRVHGQRRSRFMAAPAATPSTAPG